MVVLLNADVRLPADFLKRLAYHYQQGADYVLVDARVANCQDLFARYVDCVSKVFYSQGANCNYDIMEWTEGFSCRKEVALKAGLFPTGFPVRICAGEDGFFGQGLRRLGAQEADRSEYPGGARLPGLLPGVLAQPQRPGRGFGPGAPFSGPLALVEDTALE